MTAAVYQVVLVAGVIFLARYFPVYLTPAFALIVLGVFYYNRMLPMLDRYPAVAMLARRVGRRVRVISIWSGRKLGGFFIASPTSAKRKVVVRPLYIGSDPTRRRSE